MGMLAFGILLVVVGLVLAFTNVLGLAALSQPLIWLGWICVAIGVVLALMYMFSGRRREVIVERDTRRPGY